MFKVIKMTPERSVKLQKQISEWSEFTLSTNPSDKPRAEHAVRQLYKKLGISEPQIIWTKSPFGNSICRSILNNVAGTNLSGKNLGHDLNKYQFQQYIWRWSASELEEEFLSSSMYNLTEALDFHIQRTAQRHRPTGMANVPTPWLMAIDDLEGDAGHLMREPMEHARSVADKYITECNSSDFRKNLSFEDSLLTEAGFWKKHWRKNRREIWGDFHYVYPTDWLGQHYASQLALYNFMGEIGYSNRYKCLEEISELSKSAGCIIPCENICFMSERHTVLKVDDKGLLHCEDGPALAYLDGYEAYYWHGTAYPAEWARKTPSAENALNWRNLEQRRVAYEMVGWYKIIEQLDVVIIDQDVDPQIGQLIKVSMPDVGEYFFLRVRCGTGRDFVLPVPPEMRTALEANAWTWGLEPCEYKPEVRT
ncbi:hypothetical protein N9M10_02710 [Hellea sp.]|nr:hypothetical protein [Hellea sp.]